eukprot:2542945-Ditylum_brightwellii.AAC.1
MSNLICAQKKPPFGWYYVWLKLSNTGKPQQDTNNDMRQPGTIKVSWDQPYSNQSGGAWALSVSVVPDKGILGAEYSLIYMVDQLKKKIEVHLDNTTKDHAKRLHNLVEQFLQEAAATIWTAILDTLPAATQTNIMLKEAFKVYLEKIAEVPNFEDILIYQLQNNSKLAHMRFNTYADCCQEWVYHLDIRYLNITITRLTDQENVEAIFIHQPEYHQAKYTLEKEELMKLMAPTLMSSRTSMTPSMLET